MPRFEQSMPATTRRLVPQFARFASRSSPLISLVVLFELFKLFKLFELFAPLVLFRLSMRHLWSRHFRHRVWQCSLKHLPPRPTRIRFMRFMRFIRFENGCLSPLVQCDRVGSLQPSPRQALVVNRPSTTSQIPGDSVSGNIRELRHSAASARASYPVEILSRCLFVQLPAWSPKNTSGNTLHRARDATKVSAHSTEKSPKGLGSE